jgi:RNA polymerase sigma factor (sigma-70 family)
MVNPLTQIQTEPDEVIIRQILGGNIAVFEILIRRYNAVLYKIARSYGFNHQDAQDLMQDTHVAAYSALAQFEGRSSYKTWISTIMVNKCSYKLKYGYFKNETPADIMNDENSQPMNSYPNDSLTEQMVNNRELAIIIEKSLEQIPVIYKTVFVLREVEGFSVAESAAMLQITEVNVKVRLNRAKALLQKQIEQFYSHHELYSFNLIYCDAMVERVFSKINELNGH